jgi:hypothetical protein
MASPRGVRLGTLYALARALGVQTAQLFPQASPEPADRDPAQLTLLPIRVALTPPLLGAGWSGKHAGETDLVALRRSLAGSVRLYDLDLYDEMAVRLPALIESARAAVARNAGCAGLSQAVALRSRVLQLTGWFLAQVRAHDLAYQAIKEALEDAHACGDALMAASCVICECWLFIRQGRLLDAKRTAAATADLAEPRSLKHATEDELSAWGWLLMAWAAAVRNNQQDEAQDFLRLAKTAAAGTGTGEIRYDRFWTTLGPATVAMKEVEHHVITRNYRAALALAGQVPAARRVRADNRQRHQLDLAEAHAELGDRATAAGILTGLRARTPQWLRHQHLGRDTARKLLVSSARTLPAEVRALADFYDFGWPGDG